MIQWENTENKLPIKSWCADQDELTMEQASRLANHPIVCEHVALMPDAHVGYGMPIGGVIACKDALIPNAVGVDIGCGMGAVKTNLQAEIFTDKAQLRGITNEIKKCVPVGEGHARKEKIAWQGFDDWRSLFTDDNLPQWYSEDRHKLDQCNLGTLGGGNHFIEIQKSVNDGTVWLMLHSGSRNMGQRVANFYHKKAQEIDSDMSIELPDTHLAFLPAANEFGSAYIRDMNHALCYAMENRRLMMTHIKNVMFQFFPNIEFLLEVNIHHNYAILEKHGNEEYWIHRKGATSARLGEMGIIPGSMGTSSYIVEGLGNELSFTSCSHGAGRRLGRSQANNTLTLEECDAAMGDVVYDRFGFSKRKNADGKKMHDLSEAPLAYKDIDAVIEAESDLVKPLEKLLPLAVVKG
ncbi:MAG: RtcB family protein [Termitinemataceae bacterium]|nr:MAG: RtcB family protein [Termitinemataceae bacterium]